MRHDAYDGFFSSISFFFFFHQQQAKSAETVAVCSVSLVVLDTI